MSNSNIMDKFESNINMIRDILRKEGITGMDSIKHCLVFVFMKYLNKDTCKKLGIDIKYSFDNIMAIKDHNDLQVMVYLSKQECIINILKNKNIFWVDYKLNSSMNLQNILKKVNEIDINKLSLKADIVGIVYELHLKSGTSQAMRDLGQYFTNRIVIDYMVRLCKPTIKNKKTGEIEKVLDPSMGTGGFLTMAIKYLNENNKGINWDTNKNNIIGFDIDENVKSMALLNAFIETGQLFDKTIIKHNSLEKDYILDDGTVIDKVDVILANEPFGLKNIVHADCCERIKNLKIRGTKAEPLFLQLMMLSLNNNGRCAVVVPDGVLFNDSNLHTGTRKHLVDNLNLKKVISLNGDFFLNTGVKSSILFFVNDGITTETEFSELVFDKGELKENSIIKVDYKTIVKNDYSLFVNKYNVVKEDKMIGIQYKKLGEILSKKIGKSLSKERMINGVYPVIGGGESISGYHNEFNYDEPLICVARVGSAGYVSYISGKCYITDLVGAYSVNNNYDIKYIYYIIKYNENNIKNKYRKKTGAPSINLADLLDSCEIPIPSLNKQKEIVEMLDVIYEQIDRNNHSIKAYERIKKGIVWANTMKNCEEKKLGEICEFKKGKQLSSSKFIEGHYPVIGGGISPAGYHNEYNANENTIICSSSGANAGYINMYNKKVWLSDCFGIIPKQDINNMYLYYYLKMIQEQITSYQKGSAQPHIYSSSIENILIKTPSKEIQEKIVKECSYYDEQIDRLKQENDNLKSMNIIEACLMAETKEEHEEKAVEVTIKTKTKKSKNKEVQEIDI